ncbi:MAG TPA: radical SAM protein, partial [Candidatus Paceibacterota bacterium]|nr:radical SAM protein [Candidatus Paceibacterota bacterium]
LFLFVRPPRPLWPFNGPGSAFWPPLAFASMAAMLRQHVPDLRVQILDAPALEMGWRSLEAELRRRNPAYIGIGEEAVSCLEGLRLARLAQGLGARVIAGGCFFGHTAPEALNTGVIDVVVHGEGEQTIVELIHALRENSADALVRVNGISFRRDGETVATKPRQPIANLDDLPMPAYDLLPVERYGASSRNHPGLASIELGRGCFGCCDFCILWRQMGKFVGDRVVPHLRLKSVERLVEEIRVLKQRHGRRHLGWVDPCFNADPEIPRQLAERLLRENLAIGQSAWMRADCIVRDARSGALDASVGSGLNEVYIGVERADTAGLKTVHKNSGIEEVRAAFDILLRDHPQVFTVGTFIYGLPGDTPADIRRLYRLSLELGMDKAFFIPLTPLPGTPFWNPQLWDATGRRFREFGFLPSLKRGERSALDWTLFLSFALDWNLNRIAGYARGIFSRDARKRRMTRRIFSRSTRFVTDGVISRLFRGGNGMVLPPWYES